MNTSKLNTGLAPIIGTCAWSKEDWRGIFYPEHLGQSHWLEFYSRYFRTVEVDSTFYRVPSAHALEHWLESTPADFTFSCKMPRRITHELNLRDCDEALGFFLDRIALLQPKLGPILIQLPAHFAPKNDELALKSFLMKLPRRDFRFAVEFRHKGWHHPHLIHFFQKFGISWVWNDLSPLAETDRAPFEFVPETANFLYVRLMGDLATRYSKGGEPLHRYNSLLWPRTEALENWAAKISKHLTGEMRAFFYVSNHFEGCAPLTCQRIAAQFGMELALPQPSELAGVSGDPNEPKQLGLL